MSALAFEVPPVQPARERDHVRMLVTSRAGISHHRFLDLPDLLDPGDLLVVNTSATLPAALEGGREGSVGAMDLDAVRDWGWRIGFFIGGIAALVVLWIRRTMDESLSEEHLAAKHAFEAERLAAWFGA